MAASLAFIGDNMDTSHSSSTNQYWPLPKYRPCISTNENSYGSCLMSYEVIFKRFNLCDSNDVQLDDSTADVTLIVNNQTINAHKIVLSSHSDYFDRMFCSYFVERNQDKIAINIVDLSYKTMKTFVEFFYTLTLHITENNVQDLLIGSSVLLLKDVQETCVNYLKTMIDSDNCLILNSMSNGLHLPELHSVCMKFITKNFYLVVQNKEFINLCFEDLLTLVKDEHLFAKEEEIYNAVENWMRHNPLTRWPHIPDLLWYCRLPYILNTYQGVSRYHNYQNAKIDSLISFRSECRRPFNKGILLLSHFSSSLNAEWFDLGTGEWLTCVQKYCCCTNFKILLRKPEYLSTTILLDNGCIFSVGGKGEGRGTKSGILFNPNGSYWMNLTQMRYERIKPCVVQVGPKVFVIGGRRKFSMKNDVEYYDLRVHKWFYIQSTIEGTTSVKNGIFTVCVNNLLYIICKNVAGYMHPETMQWISITPLPNQRYGSAVCTLNKNIYVIGGYENNKYSNSVWAYCTVTNKWVSVAPLNSPRANSGVAVTNGHIYVFGGKTSPLTYSNTFEVYDPNNNMWVTSNASLPVASGFNDALIIDKTTELYTNVFDNRNYFIH